MIGYAVPLDLMELTPAAGRHVWLTEELRGYLGMVPGYSEDQMVLTLVFWLCRDEALAGPVEIARTFDFNLPLLSLRIQATYEKEGVLLGAEG